MMSYELEFRMIHALVSPSVVVSVEDDVEFVEESVKESVESESLPEGESQHDGVDGEEAGHGAAEARQHLSRRGAVCGVRVGAVGDHAGQQKQPRPQQGQQQLKYEDVSITEVR